LEAHTFPKFPPNTAPLAEESDSDENHKDSLERAARELREIFDREAQEESYGEGGAHLPDQSNPPLHNRQGPIVIDDDDDDDDNENEPAAHT